MYTPHLSFRWPSVFAIGYAALGLIAHSMVRADSIYDVTINTASLASTNAVLAFDFISGGGAPNTITLSDFSTNGILGASGPNSGTVTGTLPGTVTLSDAANFFNENLQSVKLGSTISFQMDATTNAPTGGALPDALSFFLLDSTASNSLVTTSDPTGSNSLFGLQIDGSSGGLVGVYSPIVAVTPASPVPLPGGLVLLLSGLVGAGMVGFKSRNPSKQKFNAPRSARELPPAAGHG